MTLAWLPGGDKSHSLTLCYAFSSPPPPFPKGFFWRTRNAPVTALGGHAEPVDFPVVFGPNLDPARRPRRMDRGSAATHFPRPCSRAGQNFRADRHQIRLLDWGGHRAGGANHPSHGQIRSSAKTALAVFCRRVRLDRRTGALEWSALALVGLAVSRRVPAERSLETHQLLASAALGASYQPAALGQRVRAPVRDFRRLVGRQPVGCLARDTDRHGQGRVRPIAAARVQ